MATYLLSLVLIRISPSRCRSIGGGQASEQPRAALIFGSCSYLGLPSATVGSLLENTPVRWVGDAVASKMINRTKLFQSSTKADGDEVIFFDYDFT